MWSSPSVAVLQAEHGLRSENDLDLCLIIDRTYKWPNQSTSVISVAPIKRGSQNSGLGSPAILTTQPPQQNGHRFPKYSSKGYQNTDHQMLHYMAQP